MAADADEASSLLIAQLLQEDNAYAAISNEGFLSASDDDSEGYGSRRKKKRKAKAPAVVKTVKKKVLAKKPESDGENDDGQKNKRAKPKPWTDDEEKLFLEALELYGRDWKKHAEHMGNTREPRGIASHAQKYFIKLYKEDKPLPAKVMESGEGYTLSGKPLDPNSAAARAYGLQGSEGMKNYREKMAAKKTDAKKGNSNAPTLKQLIEAGLIDPSGPSINLSYKDQTWEASINADGQIVYENETYSSPSAFSIAIKRKLTPTKKADDGWKSITYNGISLESLKNQLKLNIASEESPSDLSPTEETKEVTKDEPKVEIPDPSPPSTSIPEPSTEVDLNQLTARAKNDALLAQMKAQGVKLNQVVDGEENYRAPRKDAEADAKKREDEQARREAAARAKQEREMKKQQDAWEQKQLKLQKLYGEDGRTDYSRNRSRRKTASKFVAAPTEALQFVPTSAFQGPPASGPKSQPFHVSVHSSVYATVDLHSHLSTAEVMGFLAGRWDPAKFTINVVAAFPGKSMLDGATECEMDPVAEVSLRSTIESQGLQVVGWYHSHPTFQPVPSSCDVDNQANYQALFHDGQARMEPFIALINSPYDIRLPSSRSQFSWFYVESPQTLKSAKRIESQMICDNELSETTRHIMEDLVKEKDASSSHSVNFSHIWREDPKLGPVSFLEKLRTSLSFWLPPLVEKTRLAQMEDQVNILAANNESNDVVTEEQQNLISSFINDKILNQLLN